MHLLGFFPVPLDLLLDDLLLQKEFSGKIHDIDVLFLSFFRFILRADFLRSVPLQLSLQTGLQLLLVLLLQLLDRIGIVHRSLDRIRSGIHLELAG